MCFLLSACGVFLILTTSLAYSNSTSGQIKDDEEKVEIIPMFVFYALFKGTYQILNWFLAFKYWIVSLTCQLLIEHQPFDEKKQRNRFIIFGLYLFFWTFVDTYIFYRTAEETNGDWLLSKIFYTVYNLNGLSYCLVMFIALRRISNLFRDHP